MTESSLKKENPVQNGNKKELGLICTAKMFKLNIGYLQSLHFILFNIDNVLDFKSLQL